MENSVLVLGIVLMVAAVALVTAVFRAVGHRSPLRPYKSWIFPTAGLGFILLGRWLVQ